MGNCLGYRIVEFVENKHLHFLIVSLFERTIGDFLSQKFPQSVLPQQKTMRSCGSFFETLGKPTSKTFFQFRRSAGITTGLQSEYFHGLANDPVGGCGSTSISMVSQQPVLFRGLSG